MDDAVGETARPVRRWLEQSVNAVDGGRSLIDARSLDVRRADVVIALRPRSESAGTQPRRVLRKKPFWSCTEDQESMPEELEMK